MKSPIERPPLTKSPISIWKITVITSLGIMMLSHKSTKTNNDKHPCKNKSRKLPC